VELEAVIFDLFGTLVAKGSSSLASETRHRICATLQVDYGVFMQAWRQTDVARENWPDDNRTRPAIGRRGLQCNQPKRIEEATTTWLELVRDRLAPRQDVFDVLKSYRERRFRVGLLSDCNDDVPRLFRVAGC
jgi:FMN phosphatase YigB (HAD superfamily)